MALHRRQFVIVVFQIRQQSVNGHFRQQIYLGATFLNVMFTFNIDCRVWPSYWYMILPQWRYQQDIIKSVDPRTPFPTPFAPDPPKRFTCEKLKQRKRLSRGLCSLHCSLSRRCFMQRFTRSGNKVYIFRRLRVCNRRPFYNAWPF